MLRVDWNLLFTVINLLILFVAFRFFLFKPVQKIIAARQNEADRQLNEAKEQKKEADSLKTQYEASLANAETEKEQLLAEARNSADEAYRGIVAHAEQEAEKIREKAVTQAHQEKQQIIDSAEKEITDMVMDAAKKIVGEKTGADTDARIYDKFLDETGENA